MDSVRLFLAVVTVAAMGFLCMVAWHHAKIALRDWMKGDR